MQGHAVIAGDDKLPRLRVDGRRTELCDCASVWHDHLGDIVGVDDWGRTKIAYKGRNSS